MPNDPLAVRHLKIIFIMALLIVILVGDIGVIAVILFDIIVVAVTLAGTRGTWRVYKRSTWNRRTLTHLLAEQSMWLSLWQHNPHIQISGLMRFGYVSRIYLTNESDP